MSIVDRLGNALFEFLDKHGDFRLTEYDKDEPQKVYWDNFDDSFQPLVGSDTTFTIQKLNHWEPESTPVDVYFTFPLHILNKWAVVEDNLFGGIERGFTCRIKAYAPYEHEQMDIEEFSLDIQAGLEIDENRLLGTALLLEQATKEHWKSNKVAEIIGHMGSKRLYTGEEFEKRLMLAVLADDYSYILKAE